MSDTSLKKWVEHLTLRDRLKLQRFLVILYSVDSKELKG